MLFNNELLEKMWDVVVEFENINYIKKEDDLCFSFKINDKVVFVAKYNKELPFILSLYYYYNQIDLLDEYYVNNIKEFYQKLIELKMW